jgi:hypothetical protein
MEIVLAVLEVPVMPWQTAEQKFVSDETKATLQRHAVAIEHRAELAEVEELEHAIALAEPVIDKGRYAVRLELGLTPPEFDALAQPIAQAEIDRSPPTWLRDVAGRTMVIVPNGTMSPASAAQVEQGIYFRNIDEYNAAMRAAA